MFTLRLMGLAACPDMFEGPLKNHRAVHEMHHVKVFVPTHSCFASQNMSCLHVIIILGVIVLMSERCLKKEFKDVNFGY